MNNSPGQPTPEQLAALEAVRAKYRSAEKRAEHAKVREAIETEFPPKKSTKSNPKPKLEK